MRFEPLVSLGSIGYALGELRPIDELEALQQQPQTLTALKDRGLLSYARTDESPAELAHRSVATTLRRSGLSGPDIDAVIYASTSFWEKRFYSERDIAWLMDQYQLVNATPIGVFLPGCANALASLRIAANLIVSEGLENVMVVTTDKVTPNPSSQRIMWPCVSVLSDAAASFVVSARGVREFDVVALRFSSAPAMWNLDNTNNEGGFVLSTFKGARKTVADVLEQGGVTASHVRMLLTNNYNVPVNRMIALQCGFEESQINLINIGRFAHGFAADTLINLDDADADQPLKHSETYVLLGTGHKNWGAALIRRIQVTR